MGDSGPTAGRVLIIDDDRVFGLWATKVLQARDFYIQHVLDPVSGLRQIEAEPWDLVITDVEMPRMSGLEFLERARRLVPGLPVVVVTAHPTVDRAVTALRHSGTDFIHKPVTGPRCSTPIRSTRPSRITGTPIRPRWRRRARSAGSTVSSHRRRRSSEFGEFLSGACRAGPCLGALVSFSPLGRVRGAGAGG